MYTEHYVIQGLPETEEQAVLQIEEEEKDGEWLPLDEVLEEVSQRYE